MRLCPLICHDVNTFERYQNIKPTIENAIKGPVFNLNRICFDLKKKELIENEALSGIKEKKIYYFKNNENRDHFHAVRAALMHKKTSFEFDTSVVNMIRNSKWEKNINSVEQYLAENHYTKTQILFAFNFLADFSTNAS